MQGLIVLSIIYVEFLHELLNKFEVKANVLKNVVQKSELSMESDKKPEKCAQRKVFISFSLLA